MWYDNYTVKDPPKIADKVKVLGAWMHACKKCGRATSVFHKGQEDEKVKVRVYCKNCWVRT